MIETLSIKNLAVFDVVSVCFGELNVIHDETGSGKTHPLKLAYSIVSSLVVSAYEPANERTTKALLDQWLDTKLMEVLRLDPLVFDLCHTSVVNVLWSAP